MRKIDKLINERVQLKKKMDNFLTECDRLHEKRREQHSDIICKKKKNITNLEGFYNIRLLVFSLLISIIPVVFTYKLTVHLTAIGYGFWMIIVFIFSIYFIPKILRVLIFNDLEKKLVDKEQRIFKLELLNLDNKFNKEIDSIENKKLPIQNQINEIDYKINELERIEKEKIRNEKIEKEKKETNRKKKEFEEKRNLLIQIENNYSEGILNIKHYQFDKAILNFNKLINLKPEDFEFFYYRGYCQANKQKYSEAIEDYSKSIKLGNDKSIIYIERGKVFKQVKNYKNAISDFKKFIESTNYNSEGYYERATTKMKLGDKRGALNDFNESIKINSKYKEAFFYRGIIKNELKDKTGACVDWSRAGELGHFEAYDEIKKFCN